MQSLGIFRGTGRAALLACTALVMALGMAASAHAQAALQPAADTTTNAVADIVVTAQKRQQNQQDVPVSLTAVTAASLVANRVTNVVDLATVVPNMATRSTGGGAQTPSFTLRGVTSYGVVPGSDKEISVYLDGVYIAATVGSSLDIPDIAQVEVLRGPQGTLFGRNATVGAVSVTTRNPSDKFGLEQDFSVGNYNQFRSRTRIDTGSFGDFSASLTYVHDERRGDIRNLGAGQVFSYPASTGLPATLTSPEWLGSKDVNSWFAAIKYEHSDLRIVNKFDWTSNHYTPVGAAVVGFDAVPAALGGSAQAAAYLGGILALQNTAPTLVTNGQRPNAVNNSFTTPGYARDWGDNLTAEYRVDDHLSLKNVAAYRNTYVFAQNQLDGAGGLQVTPALAGAFGFPTALIGSPIGLYAILQATKSYQYSDELQANYHSHFLTLTAGLLYFYEKGQSGGPVGIPNNVELAPLPFGNFAYDANPSRTYYTEKSLAAYTQAEVPITSKIELVGGIRVTNDKKTGIFITTPTDIRYPNYSKTLPSYSAGVNYKPTRDILIYGKYSEAFVSGGYSGPIVYVPEKAYSFEAGIKSEWLDHRLRANLALYDVLYHDLQSAQAGSTVGDPAIGLAIADEGNLRAKGFEFESTLVPLKGVTIGAAAGYTEEHFLSVNPEISLLGTPATLSDFRPTLQPKWTVNLSGQYDTPVFGDAVLSFRMDAAWRSSEPFLGFASTIAVPAYASIIDGPPTWLVNGRIALEHITLPYGEGLLAVWAKNLTNDKSLTFPENFGFVGSSEFQAARTVGVDFSFKY